MLLVGRYKLSWSQLLPNAFVENLVILYCLQDNLNFNKHHFYSIDGALMSARYLSSNKTSSQTSSV